LALGIFGPSGDARIHGGASRFLAALDRLPAGGEARVWVRLPVQLGDMVMALPSLFTVRRAWQAWAGERRVRLRLVITGRTSVGLFQEARPDSGIDCHLDGDSPWSGSPLGILRHWGRERPLAVINYSKSDRVKVAAWLGRVPVRAGIADGSNNWCYHFSHPFMSFGHWGHMSFRYLPLTRWLVGAELPHLMEPLGPALLGGDGALATLRRQGWDGGPYVVFAPYPLPPFPERQWFPPDRPWIRLAALAREAGLTPVLAGGPERREDLDRLAAASGCLSMGGRTTLPELLALASQAQGTISVDTGIAHVAGATGRPTVVIFGWGSENKDLPCGPRVIALRGDPAGAPAYPLGPDDLRQASCPWSAASCSIPAERAWTALLGLGRE
jgi:ADP-heptose:LPS heptosyltransferase